MDARARPASIDASGAPIRFRRAVGRTTPIVAFDWLDASAARYDYLYDFAIVGVDGARRAHVWTIRDAGDEAAAAVAARRPIVTHRGAMTLETRWTGRAWTCDDNIVVRAALTRRRDDTRVVVASRAFGVVAARTETKSSPRWRRYIARVCEDTRRPSSIAGRIRRAMFSSLSTRRGRDARGVDAKRRGRWMASTTRREAATGDEGRGAGGSRATSLVKGERGVETSIDGAWEAFFDDDGALVIGGVVGDSQRASPNAWTAARADPSTNVATRWFDAGGGAHALAVATRTEVSVYAPSPSLYASTGKSWRRVAASPSPSARTPS